MTCAFCGREFDDTGARRACHSCAMFGGCRKVKCPHCGMEAPAEPASAKWLRTLLTRRRHGQAGDRRGR
jgi:hypothetical protein